MNHETSPGDHSGTAATTPAFTDPVCGMTVQPATARASTNYGGQAYYFCCPSCLQKFQADPERYLSKPAAEAPAETARERTTSTAPAGAIYTCPMDPEIRQDHPGACPKCGMALAPMGGAPAATK